MPYIPEQFETKWQKFWEDHQVFCAENSSNKPKYYVLDMFPYPSSSGLHVGHPEGYTATDIIARYKRMKGFNVLHPMGWDAFGLPAEQYALQTGVHPAKTTAQAIKTFRRQLKMLGFSFDWSREISTCDPHYYKWTQALFLELYKKGLAYQKEVPVNWCPALKTVLANEEVVDGKSERGQHPVFRVPMKQWMLKITSYAERLLKDLDPLDWPEGTKALQRNWIGKSEGLLVRFKINNSTDEIEIFTTRPDTLWGVTYIVLAPEHPLVNQISSSTCLATVQAYQQKVSQKSEITRQGSQTEKTGTFTGAYAIHPLTKEEIPIWIADYVMMSYGTGAIMAVPAHDSRDFEFAKTFQLPLKKVIESNPPHTEEGAWTGEGININSGFINGKKTAEAIELVIQWAEQKGVGKKSVQYKLRDWLFSRQRYWGEPFPILHFQDGTSRALETDELPVLLPDVKSYEPTGTGESPLSAVSEWVHVQDTRMKKTARRETDTMPGSAGSSWYFLRYCDPENKNLPFGKEAVNYWMPVDLYVGGPEHAVGHLLYARFWTKVLFDAGLVLHDEPFRRLVHQGMILGEDGEKMSKSRGNVINPDEVVKRYGADTLRLYEMFIGPLERDKPWSTTAIEGVYRLLERVWRLFFNDSGELLLNEDALSLEDQRIFHQTLKKVTEDIEGLRFNTAISQMMIFINHMTKTGNHSRTLLKAFVQILNPFAPHMTEELWEKMGETSLLTYESWPNFNPTLASEETITLAIQVLGKTRTTVEVPRGSNQKTIEELAQTLPSVQNQIRGKQILKIIFVKDKIFNFIV